uniref:GSCFA domain-containing protein n=1 Tax=Aminobacter niigataensis TaxID=83265 RepID=UPI0028527351|nr:GSCFA domain-containing protein [Aminobacter niigataensis]WMD00679.1 GSCFA domain-containing protein [Aminobacter niigataensis]
MRAGIPEQDAIAAIGLEAGPCRVAALAGGVNLRRGLCQAATVMMHRGRWTWLVCANLYSKATLLSSAVAAAAKYDFVEYFPSYEMVTLSAPADIWESDGIRVKPAISEKVLNRFTEAYVN